MRIAQYKPGGSKLFKEPSYNIDYAIEVGYQVAEIGACDLLDRA